jgi:hypothetical protein
MSGKDLVSEYNDRYVEFLQSLQEATEDKALRAKMQKQGASEEETRSAIEKQRNKRRFGKDWSEGKQGDEAKAEQAKQTAQRRAFPLRSKKPAPETADKPLTGHQKGGMKRSLKSTQAKRGPGGSKPLPIPEPKKREDSSHLTYNDMLAILLEKGYEVNETRRLNRIQKSLEVKGYNQKIKGKEYDPKQVAGLKAAEEQELKKSEKKAKSVGTDIQGHKEMTIRGAEAAMRAQRNR